MKAKLINMPVLIFAIFTMIFSTSINAKTDHYGVALKMYGESTVGLLSSKSAEAIRESRIDVAGFDCYELALLDPASNKKRGLSVDCIRPIGPAGDSKGEGFQMEAYAFFILSNGTVVNHGCSSVRPFFDGIGDAGVTHMTGQIPPSEFGAARNPNTPEICKTNVGIIYGSGKYKNASGDARLSGTFDMRKSSEGKLTFSCLFVLNIQLPKNHHLPEYAYN